MRAEHTGPRDTTALYTRVTTKTIREIMSPLERLAAADPNNADRQRDLSVSYSKIGDVLKAEGKLDEARGQPRD